MQETPLKSKRKGWFSELRHGSWEDALQEKEAVQLTPLQQGAKTTANALAVAECLEGPCIQNIHPCFTKQNPSLSRVPDEGHEERWWHPDSWVVLLWQKRSRVLEGEGALYQSSWLLVVFLVIKALICLLSLIRHQLPCHGTIKRTSLSTGSEVGLFHQWYQWMWGEESRKVHEGNQIFPLGGPLIEDLETCLGQRLPRCTAMGVGWAALACCLLSIRDLVCFITESPTGPKVNQNPRNYAEQHHEHLDCRTSNPPNLAVFPARLWPMLSTISLLYPSKS